MLFLYYVRIDKFILLFVPLQLFMKLDILWYGLLLKYWPKEIEIKPAGLSIKLENYRKKWYEELLVSIAGPAINFIIALLCYTLDGGIKTAEIIYANVLICVFNLLPIYPLDGGRIIESALKAIYTNTHAKRYIIIVSNITMIMVSFIGTIGTIYLKNLAILITIFYLWTIVIAENRKYKIRTKIKKIIKINFNQNI